MRGPFQVRAMVSQATPDIRCTPLRKLIDCPKRLRRRLPEQLAVLLCEPAEVHETPMARHRCDGHRGPTVACFGQFGAHSAAVVIDAGTA